MVLDNSASPSSCILIASLKGSHQKVVKKMSQSCQKLVKNFVGLSQIDVLDSNNREL